jgi:hypothetical protein
VPTSNSGLKVGAVAQANRKVKKNKIAEIFMDRTGWWEKIKSIFRKGCRDIKPTEKYFFCN